MLTDHRHDGELETNYEFLDIDPLLNEFAEAAKLWRTEHGND